MPADLAEAAPSARPTSQESSSIWLRRVGLTTIALTSVAMVVWSWKRWPDIMVDFGQQLYLAWRLAEGDILYSEVFYIHGPLSQYFNALVFRVFGAGLLQLAVVNLAITALLVVLLYSLLRRIGDEWSALTSCLVFVTVFAVSQYVGVGNYNYVSPYAHEVLHGMALSMAAIACFSAFQSRKSLYALAATGLLTGLVFLTKAEIFLALAVAEAVALGLMLWTQRDLRRKTPKVLAAFCLPFVIPPVVSFVLLSVRMPAREALVGTCGAWPHILAGLASGDLAGRQFFRWQMGTLNATENILAMFTTLGWQLMVVGSGVLVAWKVGRSERNRLAWTGLLVVSAVALLLVYAQQIDWLSLPRSWPLVLLGAGLAISVELLRRRTADAPNRAILRLLWIVFAFGLLLKMILNARIYHYGFALAMPAAMVIVALLVCWFPTWLNSRGLYGTAVRALALGVVLVTIFAHLMITKEWFAQKRYAVSTGADQILADKRGTQVEGLLTLIRRRAAPGQTLAVFPEGVMLNYQARLPSPIPYTNFMPTSLLRFSERQALEALDATPPDYVVLAHKDTSEFGARFFGRDYGLALFGWIRANYRPAALVGAMPLTSDKFGLLLLERKGGTSARSPHGPRQGSAVSGGR